MWKQKEERVVISEQKAGARTTEHLAGDSKEFGF